MDLGSVTVSESIKELTNRNRQNIPGFQGSFNPTIKHIPRVRLFIPVEFGRGTEFVRYQCHRIKSLKPAIKSMMVFSSFPFVLKLYNCTGDKTIMMSGLFQIPKEISGKKYISEMWTMTGTPQLAWKLSL